MIGWKWMQLLVPWRLRCITLAFSGAHGSGLKARASEWQLFLLSPCPSCGDAKLRPGSCSVMLQLKHIRQKATPAATSATREAAGGRHQKLFLQQLEHAQQQQQLQQQLKSTARQPHSHLAGHQALSSSNAGSPTIKTSAFGKHGSAGVKRAKQAGPSKHSHPAGSRIDSNKGAATGSRRNQEQLAQHRKLVSMEALRKREEDRSAWVQAYRDAKHKGSAKGTRSLATPASLARIVSVGK